MDVISEEGDEDHSAVSSNHFEHSQSINIEQENAEDSNNSDLDDQEGADGSH